ncbi:hypothetical protein [Xenorhabdus kozodoii]|uniref:Uncharacterized protein n=1 Tax=Xenorhabdus kozodoii TaxID=351676 RepID=A0A2D0LGB8_9GAMM|nr:hypothetical protein [Xenorhabdus kozodoii]PHM74692.1 hypothetical protein Xkoz_00618 [Xenorhabdus kozodoii]
MNKVKENEQSPVWAYISVLKIKLRQVSNETSIFANGKHRIAIDIYIQGADYDGNDVIVPENTLLSHSWLIDYDTEEKLDWNRNEEDDFTWSYIDKPNEFTVTPIASSLINHEEYDDSKLSRITYYVYCSPATAGGTKQIAVLIKTQIGTEYTSAFGVSSDFNAFVQITAINETHYKVSDLDAVIYVHPDAGPDVNSGQPPFRNWLQINTYIKLPRDDKYNRHIMSLDWHSNDGDHPLTGDNIPFNSMHQRYHETSSIILGSHSSYYYLHFIWELGEETKVSIGNTTWWDVPIAFNVDINIRQEGSEAVCFTIMKVWARRDSTDLLHDTWLDKFIINIYDQYGNAGRFLVQPRNDNDVEKGKVHLIDL